MDSEKYYEHEYYDYFSIREMAKILRLSRTTLYKHIKRAKRNGEILRSMVIKGVIHYYFPDIVFVIYNNRIVTLNSEIERAMLNKAFDFDIIRMIEKTREERKMAV